MIDYFHCKLCDYSIENESKKKHLNSQNHEFLTKSIISKNYVANQVFFT